MRRASRTLKRLDEEQHVGQLGTGLASGATQAVVKRTSEATALWIAPAVSGGGRAGKASCANLVRPGDPWIGISTETDVAQMAQQFLATIE